MISIKMKRDELCKAKSIKIKKMINTAVDCRYKVSVRNNDVGIFARWALWVGVRESMKA